MGAPKLKNTKGTILRLLGYVRYVKYEMLTALIALVLSTACTLITPAISGKLIDLLNQTHGIDPTLTAFGSFGTYLVTALATQAILGRNNGTCGETLSMGSMLFRGLTASLLTAGVAATATGAVLWTAETAVAELVRLIGLMALLYIVSSVLSLLQQLMLVRVAQQTVRILRKDLFDHLQTLPLRFFDSHPHGELMSRLSNDVDNVSNMLSSSITQVMSSAITLVISLSMTRRDKNILSRRGFVWRRIVYSAGAAWRSM
jgi:ABC-type multidrug transport system fused ATPase/permease subunit